jgi:hypothetical protein
MMSQYTHELPGDVLRDLLRQHHIDSIREFAKQHELRISKALAERLEKEGRIDTISEREEQELYDGLALKYDRWYNRFQILWNPKEDPKSAWRAPLVEQDIDALIIAQWFAEESEMHVRLQNAIRLQNALYIELFSYGDLERMFPFEHKIDPERVYDALCYSLSEFVRSHPETKDWPFTSMATFVSGLSKATLRALADLGLIDEGDWLDRLPGLERTRAVGPVASRDDEALYQGIVDWVRLMLEDRLEGTRA